MSWVTERWLSLMGGGNVDAGLMAEFAHEFAEVGAQLHGGTRGHAALQQVVELAVKHVPGCEWASITVVSRGSGRTVAASDPIAQAADELQYQLRQGPCLDAAIEDADQFTSDVVSESRWPDYTRALAKRSPVRSILGFRLPADQAALNLYASTASAFDVQSVEIGTVFAAHVSTAVVLSQTRDLADSLQVALDSNRQIGAAMGILMAYHRVTQEEAFALLRMASQNLHIKLREVARDVLDTGALPELPPLRPKAPPAAESLLPRHTAILE